MKKIISGPFKRMEFVEQSGEGCHIAKLLGTYEQPLFPHIEDAISAKFDVIINVDVLRATMRLAWQAVCLKQRSLLSTQITASRKLQETSSDLQSF